MGWAKKTALTEPIYGPGHNGGVGLGSGSGPGLGLILGAGGGAGGGGGGDVGGSSRGASGAHGGAATPEDWEQMSGTQRRDWHRHRRKKMSKARAASVGLSRNA